MNSGDLALWHKCAEQWPFLDLFEQLRSAGLMLSIEDYELLQRALLRGRGSSSWAELERVCALLWVKPSANYDGEIFQREFRLYREAITAELAIREPLTPPKVQRPAVKTKKPVELVWPQIPHRDWTVDRPRDQQVQGVVGVIDREQPLISADRRFVPSQLPIDEVQVRDSWRSLGQAGGGLADQVDLEQTVAQVSRDGFLIDVALKSAARGRSELVILLDEGAAMWPYQPALGPLWTAIDRGAVHPARRYRFTGYPQLFLDNWQSGMQAEATVLAGLHRMRTVVLVVSDGGAAMGTQNEDLVLGIKGFLGRWRGCAARLLWLNPVPEERWLGTPAIAIQELLNAAGGAMLPLAEFNGAGVRRLCL
jgi:uncharacterized protein